MLSDERVMWQRLRNRKEWTFFSVLPKADGPLAVTWWCILLLRGILPALFAISMGVLVAAVQHGASLAGPLASTGIVFVLLQVLTPIHQAVGANLGDRTAAWLYDLLTEACVRPAGMGHLEDPTLTSDLTVARDFDLGMTGPPLSISMDFIAGGLVEFVAGVASAAVLFAFAWWAPLVLAGGWLATHWLLRESAVWHDRNTEEVRGAQRDADYAYRLAVDPPASKELRLFGLAGVDDRSIHRPSHAPAPAAIRRYETPRAAAASERSPRPRREHSDFLVARKRGITGRALAGGNHRIRTERDRRFDDCVRRTQLGARRRRCAGRGRSAPGTRNGQCGRASHW